MRGGGAAPDRWEILRALTRASDGADELATRETMSRVRGIRRTMPEISAPPDPRPAPSAVAPAVQALIEDVAARHGLTGAALRRPCRKRRVAWPRQEAMAALRDRGMTFEAIGGIFGVDHTAAMYGVRRHRQRQGEGAA
jgi:hypothetical protein